jgi:hypothetical protein
VASQKTVINKPHIPSNPNPRGLLGTVSIVDLVPTQVHVLKSVHEHCILRDSLASFKGYKIQRVAIVYTSGPVYDVGDRVCCKMGDLQGNYVIKGLMYCTGYAYSRVVI